MTDESLKQDLYCFHNANIHEQRWAARLARATPALWVVVSLVVTLVGVFKSISLLLAWCAIFNLALWLWICSASVFGIMGSLTVRETLDPGEGISTEAETDGKGEVEQQDPVRHVIVFPNYEEPETMLAETLVSLSEAKGSKDFWVVLAMEERETEAKQKAENLIKEHKNRFAKLLAFHHPKDLKETHLDGGASDEVPGKASNLKWAVNKVYESCCGKDANINVQSTVLTVADADVFFHPNYFQKISDDFGTMRNSPGEQHRWTMWQAPQLPYRNYYNSPAPSRVWGYISSVYEFGGVSSLSSGGHHMVFSAYSVHFQLAVDAQLWDGDVIAEDHHAYIKAFLYSARVSAIEAIAEMEDGKPSSGCRPKLRVRPVMLPVKSTSVIDEKGYWHTYLARWQQATRHCQGVAELSYSLLATWDLACTLPWRVYNLHFLMHLAKVILRPFFIHILPIVQSLGLGVLTLYWLVNNKRVPMCPDRIWMASSDGETLLCGLAGAWALMWPVMLPFMLLACANWYFLCVSFAEPATHGQKSLWYKCNGDVPETFGSASLTIGLLIAFDCIVFVMPLMGVYGLFAELLAYWNVLWHGNCFKYVTAGKATTLGQDYGSTSASTSS